MRSLQTASREHPCAAAKTQGSQKKKRPEHHETSGAITLSTLVNISQREQPLAETWKASLEGSRIQMQVRKQGQIKHHIDREASLPRTESRELHFEMQCLLLNSE